MMHHQDTGVVQVRKLLCEPSQGGLALLAHWSDGAWILVFRIRNVHGTSGWKTTILGYIWPWIDV